MSAIPDRRRRRTIAMFVATVLVMLSVPALGFVGVRAVLDSTGGRDAQADNLPVKTFPNTPTALYLTVDDEGVLSSATMFVLSPVGVGGSIVSVPVNASVGLFEDVSQSLQGLFSEGGADAAELAVESLLLAEVNVVAVIDEAMLTDFLLPFAPFTITLTTEVALGGAAEDAAGDEVLRPGTVVLDADTASKVLTEGAGEGRETERKGNIEGFWAGFAAAVSGGRATLLATDVPPVDIHQFVARLVAARVQSRGLTTSPLTPEQNPSGEDMALLDQAEAVFVFGSVAPGQMSAPKDGPIFRIEAPPGYDLQVKQTIATILFVGANVVSVDTASPARPDTVFLVPDEIDRNRAQVADAIFGAIVFEEPTVRIDGVNVTLILGTDYLSTIEI